MKIDVITLFPEMIKESISHSIIGRACQSDAIEVHVTNLRDYTHDKHRTVDDSPYGGGAGMVMKAEPLCEAIEAIRKLNEKRLRVILMSPRGQKLTQGLVSELAQEPGFVLICGHYEGVDERVREHMIDREISIGDYVLTGGELPALVLIDAVARLMPGVLGKDESSLEESFTGGLLEYPHYTRPAEFRGWSVPEVLLSGHHAEIAGWRRRESLKVTLENRPDLLRSARLTKQDIEVLGNLGASEELLDELLQLID